MRLVDLNAKWCSTGAGRQGMGISFECPHCPPGKRVMISVWFKNPVDGGPHINADPVHAEPSRFLWERQGTTLDTLSLFPSVDYSGAGHWHGLIRADEIC